MAYDGSERRRNALSEKEIEVIAERAAKKALEMVYMEVGKALLKRIAFLAGATVVGFFLWLKSKGLV